ncbi:hypothetical protein [Nannocystis sp.]|uniref:hypothetical protein n=1 Tax=Nannocystis sp. TaxID=1962667 RepID=UPI0025FC1938|nr:hypothetical protein [Nannocystis sp.]MBK7830229.1 hypothetical protein [Nannocystis sp.]
MGTRFAPQEATMEIVLGPILRLRAVEPAPARWRVSVLVVVTGAEAPTLTWTSSARETSAGAPLRLATHGARTVWSIELAVARGARAGRGHVPDRRRGLVALHGAGDARAAANGLQHVQRLRDAEDGEVGARPLRAVGRGRGLHAQTPYHLMMMGGDQVYADPLWETIDELSDWSHSGSFIADVTGMSGALAEKVDRFYFELYCKRWAQPQVAAMLASIPTVMMWDDHDIFDGWGSYPDSRHRSQVYQGIFAAARRWFCVFQLHRRPARRRPTSSSRQGPTSATRTASTTWRSWRSTSARSARPRR